MKSENKKIKRVIGISLVVIAGITAFYQYRYSKVQEESKDYVTIATKQINEFEKITENNVKVVERSKTDILKGNINDTKLVIGSIAKETIYENEDINLNRLMTEEEFNKKDYRLISIKVSKDQQDALVGYDVKPFDKVDLLYFDKEGIYEGKPFIEGQVIYDLKSSEGISYENRGTEDSFKPSFALIWVEKSIAEKIYEKEESKGYFRFHLYNDRAVEENNSNKVTNIINKANN